MVGDACWLIAVLLLGLAWLVGTWQPRSPSQPDNVVGAAVIQRLLKPRTPDDCPTCRAHAASPTTDPVWGGKFICNRCIGLTFNDAVILSGSW